MYKNGFGIKWLTVVDICNETKPNQTVGLPMQRICIHTVINGGARGVMIIVAGYGLGDTSSNSGPDWLHFT